MIRPIGVDAVERQGVEVDVQVERRPEALDERDGAALLRLLAPVLARTSSKLREQRADERAQHLARQPRVVRAAVAERVRKRQHPLPDRDLGQHPIDQMRRRVRHPAAAARRTEAAALAREGDQAVVTAGVAVHAEEAVREHAAAEEGAKLLLDEARSGLLSVCGAREEAFELLANDLMKKSLLRFMALVLGHEVPDRDRRGESAEEEARADRSAWHWGDTACARSVVSCGEASQAE